MGMEDYKELETMKYSNFKSHCKHSTLKECEAYKEYLKSNMPPLNSPNHTKFLQKIRYIDKVISGEIWN